MHHFTTKDETCIIFFSHIVLVRNNKKILYCAYLPTCLLAVWFSPGVIWLAPVHQFSIGTHGISIRFSIDHGIYWVFCNYKNTSWIIIYTWILGNAQRMMSVINWGKSLYCNFCGKGGDYIDICSQSFVLFDLPDINIL